MLDSAFHSNNMLQVLELCQAAYIIATLQSCVKDVKTRQRLITKYHPMLVNLLRASHMMSVKHNLPESESDWHIFIYKESCIRLIHWVFINDAWFSLFSNHPPAMTLLDVNNQLPCEDKLWNAQCNATFQSLMIYQNLSASVSCLNVLMSGLLGEMWTDKSMEIYRQLDVKHFLIIIFGTFKSYNI